MIQVLVFVVFSGIATQAWCAERIIETATQTTISQAKLIERLQQPAFILLGEVHDEPIHHIRRAKLIEALAHLKPVVIAEQLEATQQVTYTGQLVQDVTRAGFDQKMWDWAYYSPLFSVLEVNKITLMGGNLSIDAVRSISKQGASAIPEALSQMISQANLTASGEIQLVTDLETGHCGHLPKQYVPNFILAQRARDASMLKTMLDITHKPVILLAGNGHVRKDYGIPTLLQSNAQSQISIGFLQLDTLTPDQAHAYQQQFDYIWLTGAVNRDDPCALFKMAH